MLKRWVNKQFQCIDENFSLGRVLLETLGAVLIVTAIVWSLFGLQGVYIPVKVTLVTGGLYLLIAFMNIYPWYVLGMSYRVVFVHLIEPFYVCLFCLGITLVFGLSMLGFIALVAIPTCILTVDSFSCKYKLLHMTIITTIIALISM